MVGIDRIMSEGRALTNCIGNGVATMVIAKLQGERDDVRFQAVLDDPSLADPDRVDEEPQPVAEPQPRVGPPRAGARAGPTTSSALDPHPSVRGVQARGAVAVGAEDGRHGGFSAASVDGAGWP